MLAGLPAQTARMTGHRRGAHRTDSSLQGWERRDPELPGKYRQSHLSRSPPISGPQASIFPRVFFKLAVIRGTLAVQLTLSFAGVERILPSSHQRGYHSQLVALTRNAPCLVDHTPAYRMRVADSQKLTWPDARNGLQTVRCRLRPGKPRIAPRSAPAVPCLDWTASA